MHADTLRFLAEYNSFANGKMDAIIGGLDEARWSKEFGGYFPSIRAMCNHIYVCDVNWLMRFSKHRPFAFVAGTRIGEGLSFRETALRDIPDYLGKRKALDAKIVEFAAELAESDVSAELAYVDSHGQTYRRNFGKLVLHMLNHETHHRGMISLYLEELGIANDFNNIYDML